MYQAIFCSWKCMMKKRKDAETNKSNQNQIYNMIAKAFHKSSQGQLKFKMFADFKRWCSRPLKIASCWFFESCWDIVMDSFFATLNYYLYSLSLHTVNNFLLIFIQSRFWTLKAHCTTCSYLRPLYNKQCLIGDHWSPMILFFLC